ncbi:glycosyltransferase [Polynucleobacter alcilacus]|uniref:glycosyltransferase n=1 Tax=Polynucleobacter alcilacus TaxID=1819739 RepID=UPI001C0AD30A|nr:glycosyltransferase [Polynucleobacter alcilacus]MBU3568571.1 glycosyltransferase [Polynucleobacter alcilacus]
MPGDGVKVNSAVNADNQRKLIYAINKYSKIEGGSNEVRLDLKHKIYKIYKKILALGLIERPIDADEKTFLEYIDWVDIDFFESQKNYPSTYANYVEQYLSAILLSDALGASVSPFANLYKYNREAINQALTGAKFISNFGLWKIFKNLKVIRFPGNFARLGAPHELSYADLMKERDAPLYWWLFRDNLISKGLSTEESRVIIKNKRNLTFKEYDNPKISFVFPVYGGYNLLNQALISLERTMGSSISYEIICVDDYSPDYSDFEYSHFSGIKVFRAPKNLGFSLACNFGASKAKGEYLFLINTDTIVCRRAIKEALATIESDSKIGLVGSKLIHLDGTVQEAGGVVWANSTPANFARGAKLKMPEIEFNRNVDYVSGAAFLVSLKVWKKLKGFDPIFTPAYYEDTDFCTRIIANGMKVVYCAKSNIIHAEGGTNGTDLKSGFKLYQRKNEAKYQQKWKKFHLTNNAAQGDYFGHLSEGKDVIIFMDHYIPRNDRDAGSKATYDFLTYLADKKQNNFIIFWPDNLFPDPKYYDTLTDLGIMVVSGAEYINGLVKLATNLGDRLKTIYVSRPTHSINVVRQMNQALLDKTVYVGHDIHFERMRRELEYKNPHTDNYVFIDKSYTNTIRSIENKLWRACKNSVYFTQRECDFINELVPNKASLIPLYSQHRLKESNNKKKAYEDKKLIVFAGGFDHPPNKDAMMWLLAAITPNDKILKNFLLIGSNIPPDLKKVLDLYKIKTEENISNDELDAHYDNARLVMAPMQYGSGLKGKVVEAIGKGIPVITTSIGMEGLDDHGATPIFNDASSFVKAIKMYFSQKDKWLNLRDSQTKLLEKYYEHAKYENGVLNELA